LTVLCAAVSALLSALTFAQSSVTLYGLIDVGVRYQRNKDASLTTVGDGAFTGSRWGIRGTEDLGGGLKTIFSLESGFDPSTGVLQQANASPTDGSAAAPAGRAFGREAYVGLESSQLGQVTLGRQYTLAHALSNRFQPLPNPNLGAVNMFSGHQVTRQDNMVRYTKNFGSVGLHAAYTFSEGNGRGRALGVSYSAAPLELVAFYQEVNNAAGTSTRRLSGAGGSYAIGQSAKLFLGYMKRDDKGASTQENDIVNLGFNYTVPSMPSMPLVPLVLTVSYGQDRQTQVNPGTKKTAYVAASYLLSKRTDIYAELDHNRLSGKYPQPSFMTTRSATVGTTIGLRHRF